MKINPRDVKNDFQLLQPDGFVVCTIEISRKIEFLFLRSETRRQREREREQIQARSARERLEKSRLTFLCCRFHTASRWVVVVATVLCPRRSDSCHYSHDEINDFCDLRCCRLMLMKYQPRDVMVVTRVRPSSEVLFHGDAMDVGWWTINWDWILRASVCVCVVCERRKQMEINQTITKTR